MPIKIEVRNGKSKELGSTLLGGLFAAEREEGRASTRSIACCEHCGGRAASGAKNWLVGLADFLN